MIRNAQALTLESLSKAFPNLPNKLEIRRHFKLISGPLETVESSIRHQAGEFDPAIVGYLEYACESKGKRIRPALALLTAQATGKINKYHIDLAVVVELIHLATLVHDDIMDGASKRRGQPTAYAKWGAELSVLLGDSLFCQALMLCSKFPTTEVSRRIAASAKDVCSGEILQTQRRFDLKLSLAEYLRIIEMKTAALFRVSTELAALLNDCPESHIEACRQYGDYLGIAYQIYDDCLDLVGTEGAAEKTVGIDLAKGKLTLPLLHVLHHAEEDERQALSEVILHGSNDDRLELLQLVVARGGLKEAVRTINDYLDKATNALSALPPSEAREALEAIPQALSTHIFKLAPA